MKSEHWQEEAVRLLTDLLSIPSVNGRDNEGRAAVFLRDCFAAQGIDARVQEIDALHANIAAFLPGRDPNETMIWNGHLDTVPYGDPAAWSSDPSVPSFRNGRIYGRGASDMKSGLAAMVFALCSLKQQEIRPRCNILFIGTCDEEKGGLGAEAALELLRKRDEAGAVTGPMFSSAGEQTGPRPFLLIGEPTALRPGTAQKGCLWLQLAVKGRTSHGAYPDRGVNAITCGMRVAETIADYVSSFSHPLLGGATAQVTRIEGGVASNMTPDACTMVMDIRMVPGLDARRVMAKGREALAAEQAEHPGLDVIFEKLNDRRAIEIDPSHSEVKRLAGLLHVSGNDDMPIGINFFTDASVMDREDRMDICLFGPGDPALAHQPDEYVETDRYLEAIRILEAFAAGEGTDA